jgi:hypothetical protein
MRKDDDFTAITEIHCDLLKNIANLFIMQNDAKGRINQAQTTQLK